MPQSAAAPRNMALSQLLTNQVLDPRILNAMVEVPREPFLPESLKGSAYVDDDLQVAPGRFLLAPLLLARLLELAEIEPSSRVLVVGALSGYAAAIAAKLAGHVVAIETDSSMVTAANEHLKRLHIKHAEVKQVNALTDGYQKEAPYDAIILCGAVGFIPETLGAQLTQGGRLTAIKNLARRPDAPEGLGRMLLVRRLGSSLQYREHFDASSALLPGFEPPQGFTF